MLSHLHEERKSPQTMRRRKRFGQCLRGWQTLAAAGVAFVAALTAAFIGLIKPGSDDPVVPSCASSIVPNAHSSVTIFSVSLSINSKSDRVIEVKGNFACLRFYNHHLATYAVARPSDGQPVGGLVPDESRPVVGNAVTRQWHVSEAISAGQSVLVYSRRRL